MPFFSPQWCIFTRDLPNQVLNGSAYQPNTTCSLIGVWARQDVFRFDFDNVFAVFDDFHAAHVLFLMFCVALMSNLNFQTRINMLAFTAVLYVGAEFVVKGRNWMM